MSGYDTSDYANHHRDGSIHASDFIHFWNWVFNALELLSIHRKNKPLILDSRKPDCSLSVNIMLTRGVALA